MFHDTVPEEREEQHQPLIELLRRGLHDQDAHTYGEGIRAENQDTRKGNVLGIDDQGTRKGNAPTIHDQGTHTPLFLSSFEQAEIVERVRGRLGQVGAGAESGYEESHGSKEGILRFAQNDRRERGRQGARRRFFASLRMTGGVGKKTAHLLNGLVAVLVVGILIGVSLFLFRPTLRQSVSRPPVASTGPSASTEVNGLEATIHLVTVGPYFLSELVAVDVSLSNHTRAPYRMGGLRKVDMACSSAALSVQITGGNAPFYTLPMLDVGCFMPMFLTTLEPDQTLTLHYDVPVTKSGEVIIMMGGMSDVPQTGPLAGHWPSLHIHVNAQIPANRAISLHEEGMQVIVEAPGAARTHLLYRETISCDGYLGMGEGIADWSSLATTKLPQPACPTGHKHWQYMVSAPGYSIVAGKRDF